MTDEEMNTTIAKAVGWAKCDPDKFVSDELWHLKGRGFAWEKELPNYVHDLNAMHHAEAWAHNESGRGYEYDMALCKVVEAYETGMPCNHMRLYHATARQRAEAFIATLAK